MSVTVDRMPADITIQYWQGVMREMNEVNLVGRSSVAPGVPDPLHPLMVLTVKVTEDDIFTLSVPLLIPSFMPH